MLDIGTVARRRRPAGALLLARRRARRSRRREPRTGHPAELRSPPTPRRRAGWPSVARVVGYTAAQLAVVLGSWQPLGASRDVLLAGDPAPASPLLERPRPALAEPVVLPRGAPASAACSPGRSCWASPLASRSRACSTARSSPTAYIRSTASTRGPAGDRPAHQRPVLHRPPRRQLVHRPLPARTRLRPVGGRADRLELRSRGQAREPVPGARRQRDDGRRRALDHQRRVLEHLVPASPGRRSAPGASSATTSPTRSQSRVGDDSLLATKVAVPIDGEAREGAGLLGSPSFEIPRSVERDGRFDHLKRGAELARACAARTATTRRRSASTSRRGWATCSGSLLIGSARPSLRDARARPRSRRPGRSCCRSRPSTSR